MIAAADLSARMDVIRALLGQFDNGVDMDDVMRTIAIVALGGPRQLAAFACQDLELSHAIAQRGAMETCKIAVNALADIRLSIRADDLRNVDLRLQSVVERLSRLL